MSRKKLKQLTVDIIRKKYWNSISNKGKPIDVVAFQTYDGKNEEGHTPTTDDGGWNRKIIFDGTLSEHDLVFDPTLRFKHKGTYSNWLSSKAAGPYSVENGSKTFYDLHGYVINDDGSKVKEAFQVCSGPLNVISTNCGNEVNYWIIDEDDIEYKSKDPILSSQLHDMDNKLYDIFSKKPNDTVGNKPRLELYRKPGYPKFAYTNKSFKQISDSKATSGKVRVADQPDLMRGTKVNGKWMVDIAFTAMGDKGPLILFLHGVPSNRKSYYQMMNLLKPFCRCVAIDMLGMGSSQVVRKDVYNRYKNSKNPLGWQYDCWLWKHDADYIKNFMQKMYPDEKFIFYADDWGGGSAVHYAVKYPETLQALCLLDPVAFDGYPVNEIQAIGRAAAAPDEMYQRLMSAFDQVAIQIIKTMVHNPDKVLNQYVYRWILYPYVKVNYVKGFSSTMTLKWNNLRNLSDRSFTLGGPQLLPYHSAKNLMGVKYSKFKVPMFVQWGSEDNMMPEAQRHRFRAIVNKATNGKVKVFTQQIPDAGHLAALDQPDIVAAGLLDHLMGHMPLETFGDYFFGFAETKLWKGDEKRVLEELRGGNPGNPGEKDITMQQIVDRTKKYIRELKKRDVMDFIRLAKSIPDSQIERFVSKFEPGLPILKQIRIEGGNIVIPLGLGDYLRDRSSMDLITFLKLAKGIPDERIKEVVNMLFKSREKGMINKLLDMKTLSLDEPDNNSTFEFTTPTKSAPPMVTPSAPEKSPPDNESFEF